MPKKVHIKTPADLRFKRRFTFKKSRRRGEGIAKNIRINISVLRE